MHIWMMGLTLAGLLFSFSISNPERVERRIASDPTVKEYTLIFDLGLLGKEEYKNWDEVFTPYPYAIDFARFLTSRPTINVLFFYFSPSRAERALKALQTTGTVVDRSRMYYPSNKELVISPSPVDGARSIQVGPLANGNHLAWLHSIISEPKAKWKRWNKTLMKMARENQDALTHQGLEMARNHFRDIFYRFQLSVNQSKVIGCESYDTRNNSTLANVNMSECLSVLSTILLWEDETKSECSLFTPQFSYIQASDLSACAKSEFFSMKHIEWLTSSDQKRTEGCRYVQENRRGVREMSPATLDECLAQKPPKAIWIGEKHDRCALFTDNSTWLRDVEIDACGNTDTAIENANGWTIILNGPPIPKFSFFHLNRAAGTSNGIAFPRSNDMIYRGMGFPQFDVVKGVRSLLGDAFSVVESKTLTALKLSLMKMKVPFQYDMSYLNFNVDVENALKANGDDPMREPDALRTALSIIDARLMKFTDPERTSRFINYNSYDYIDWPYEQLYSSYAYRITSVYGPMIVAYRDTHHRGVDLSWFNNVLYNHLYDTGEYLMPMYIAADELQGFHLMSWKGQYNSYTAEAYYRVTFNNRNFILVFDGSSDCIYQGENQMYYGCKVASHENAAANSPTQVDSKPLRPKAVLALCSSGPCSVPNSIFEKYALNPQAMDPKNMEKIKAIRIQGKKVKVFYKPATLSDSQSESDL